MSNKLLHGAENVQILRIPALHGKVPGLEIAADRESIAGICSIQEQSECNLPEHLLLATARGRC